MGAGKKLGYPTANLECGNVMCPMPGVYAAHATFDGVTRDAVGVVGVRKEDGKPLIEVLVLDFQGDLYGKELEVKILDKISEIQHFENKSDLLKKIEKDIKEAKKYFA